MHMLFSFAILLASTLSFKILLRNSRCLKIVKDQRMKKCVYVRLTYT